MGRYGKIIFKCKSAINMCVDFILAFPVLFIIRVPVKTGERIATHSGPPLGRTPAMVSRFISRKALTNVTCGRRAVLSPHGQPRPPCCSPWVAACCGRASKLLGRCSALQGGRAFGTSRLGPWAVALRGLPWGLLDVALDEGIWPNHSYHCCWVLFVFQVLSDIVSWILGWIVLNHFKPT